MCLCTICHRTDQSHVPPLAQSPRGLRYGGCVSPGLPILTYRRGQICAISTPCWVTCSCYCFAVAGAVGRATATRGYHREGPMHPALPHGRTCFSWLISPPPARGDRAAVASADHEVANSAFVTVTRVSLGTTPTLWLCHDIIRHNIILAGCRE